MAVTDTGLANTSAISAFAVYLFGVLMLAGLAHRYQTRRGFLREYFLSGRGLGKWTLAFSFAATSASGGSFMGFPSLVYKYGWTLALWIAGYVVVPLMIMGLMGKRLNQVARRLGSLTIPDLLRDRYQSGTIAVVASIVVIIFYTAMMVAQFKAGGLIMQTLFGIRYETALLVFAVSVVLYTSFGGFRAVVWTDVMQGVVMVAGILIMLPLALSASGGLEKTTKDLLAQDPGLVFVPGPVVEGEVFLPLGLGISFFFLWTMSGSAQPSTMVRLIAFRDTRSLSRALFLLCFHFSLVYIPMLIIFIIARGILPPLADTDQVMPVMAIHVAPSILAGILIAAPYAAIMSSVDSFLLLISSSCVRDIYQRMINPGASETTMRRLSYASTAVVGGTVMLLAFRPPELLQYTVVFAGAGLAAAFLVPVMMGLFWRRSTAHGAVAAMSVGAGTVLFLYSAKPLLGVVGRGDWASALRLPAFLGLEPSLWGLAASAVAGILVSLTTPLPADRRVIAALFPPDETSGGSGHIVDDLSSDGTNP